VSCQGQASQFSNPGIFFFQKTKLHVHSQLLQPAAINQGGDGHNGQCMHKQSQQQLLYRQLLDLHQEVGSLLPATWYCLGRTTHVLS
jgi:hypothetical protein